VEDNLNQLNLWLSLLFTVAMAALMMPSVVTMNQGKMVRNIALWLAIFLGLAIVYRFFGPFNTVSRQLQAPASQQENFAPKEPGEHIDTKDL
jgi:hypothetical protein